MAHFIQVTYHYRFVPECAKSLVYASEMWLVHYDLLYEQKMRSHREMMTLIKSVVFFSCFDKS